MKKLTIFLLSALLFEAAFSQSTTRLAGDSIRMFSPARTGAELILENDTRNRSGAYLKNIFNGRTEFNYVVDSLYLGHDTVFFRLNGIHYFKLSAATATPTFEQTIINGNTLSADRTINLNQHGFSIYNGLSIGLSSNATVNGSYSQVTLNNTEVQLRGLDLGSGPSGTVNLISVGSGFNSGINIGQVQLGSNPVNNGLALSFGTTKYRQKLPTQSFETYIHFPRAVYVTNDTVATQQWVINSVGSLPDNLVPYTGATQDVDLDGRYLYAGGLKITDYPGGEYYHTYLTTDVDGNVILTPAIKLQDVIRVSPDITLQYDDEYLLRVPPTTTFPDGAGSIRSFNGGELLFTSGLTSYTNQRIRINEKDYFFPTMPLGSMYATYSVNGIFADATGNIPLSVGSGTVTALTGDVSASGTGSVPATIANNAVTNAKAAQMPANSLKGNNTGSTSNASDLTASQARTLLSINNVDNTPDASKPVSTATQTALDLKVNSNTAITGATKTKITYDSKGLVTSGSDLTAGDIPNIAESQVTNLTTDLSGKLAKTDADTMRQNIYKAFELADVKSYPVSFANDANIEFYGTSFTAQYGASDMTNKGFAAIVAKEYNKTMVNRGWAGASDSWINLLFNLYTGSTTTRNFVFELGINNARNATGIKSVEKYKANLMNMIAGAWNAAGVPGNSGTITKTGTWTATLTNTPIQKRSVAFGGQPIFTTASGATASYSFTGNDVSIGTYVTDSIHRFSGSFDYYVDNIKFGTYKSSAKTDGVSDANDSGYIANSAIILNNLGSGSHTVKITTLSADTTWLDFFSVMKPANTASPIVVTTLPNLPVTGNSNYQLYVKRFNDTLRAIVASLAGGPIVIADQYKYLNSFGSDSLHPSDLGHRQDAYAIQKVVNPYTPNSLSNYDAQNAGLCRQVLVSNVQLNNTGNTTENTVFTGTIPGGTLGVNGMYEIILLGSCTNNANAKAYKIKFNGTTVSASSFTTSASWRHHITISNRNSLTSQVWAAAGAGSGVGFSNSGSAITTSSFNTAADITVTITLQNGNAADASAIEAFSLRAIN